MREPNRNSSQIRQEKSTEKAPITMGTPTGLGASEAPWPAQRVGSSGCQCQCQRSASVSASVPAPAPVPVPAPAPASVNVNRGAVTRGEKGTRRFRSTRCAWLATGPVEHHRRCVDARMHMPELLPCAARSRWHVSRGRASFRQSCRTGTLGRALERERTSHTTTNGPRPCDHVELQSADAYVAAVDRENRVPLIVTRRASSARRARAVLVAGLTRTSYSRTQ